MMSLLKMIQTTFNVVPAQYMYVWVCVACMGLLG